jgi:ubiquinone/menaquinone biosynthesis C-methylase UbiE
VTETKEWIHDFFGGEQDLYGTAYTAVGMFEKRNRDAEKEVDAAIVMLKASPGSHILDWCGGWGRHAVPLARRGYKVTLLDFSKEYLERAEAYARAEGVSLDLVHADFRKTPPEIQADYAVNLFTAGLGYLGEENDIVALSSLKTTLKPGARILIDTMNLFWIMRNFMPSAWYESADGTKWFLEKRKFDFWTNTVITSHIYRDRQTEQEMTSEGTLRVYSPTDLAGVLKGAGFVPKELFGDFDGSEFTLTSKRVVMTALRP